MSERFRLDRFVDAQVEMFDRALCELRDGRKRGHWIWFIFPQLAALGRSPTAKLYGIGSIGEAVAYLAHPLLGPRLHACLDALAAIEPPNAELVFGGIDAMKLRSSLTLFAAAGGGAAFDATLARWFAGARDPLTVELLACEHG